MKVIDLCQEHDSWYRSIFLGAVIDIIKEKKIRNWMNYRVLLEEKLYDHDCFHLLVDEDAEELLGFAGMYNNGIYPDTTARILNRAYYTPAARHSGLVGDKDGGVNRALFARYIVPEQIRIAKDLGYESVFFSVEFARRRQGLETVVARMNEHHDHDGIWEVLPHMYFTCPKYDTCLKDPTCWQNVAFMSLEQYAVCPLKCMPMEDWYKLTGK